MGRWAPVDAWSGSWRLLVDAYEDAWQVSVPPKEGAGIETGNVWATKE